MIKLKNPRALLALVLLVALALPVLGPEFSVPDARAESGDWKNVSLIYTTDIKGKIEPCG